VTVGMLAKAVAKVEWKVEGVMEDAVELVGDIQVVMSGA